MLKIKKGLKKKKGKKDKGDDLFDPEQLAKYKKELEENRREASSSAAALATTDDPAHEESGGVREEDDEWKRFKLLTAGIDSTLKKTSGDLDRIKTSSYFQRKQPLVEAEPVKEIENWEGFDKGDPESEHFSGAEFGQASGREQCETNDQKAEAQAEHVEEPEEEIVLEDELFDTSFVDAIASGQIKLAYIPDSPTEDPDGDDPFDTSGVAEVVKKIAEEEKKEKRKVNLGSAVGFLTGKAAEEDRQKRIKSSAIASHRRRRPENINLLGDFDDDSFVPLPCETHTVEKSDFIDADDTPDINSETLTPCHIAVTPNTVKNTNSGNKDLQELLAEFETFGESEGTPNASTKSAVLHDEEYFLEDEFAELATQSLSKSGFPTTPSKEPSEPDPFDTSYAAALTPADELSDKVLVASSSTPKTVISESAPIDPFDTSSLTHLQPGSAELKLIEQELAEVEGKIPVRPPPPILFQSTFKKLPSEDDDFDFDPRKDETPANQPEKEEHPLDSLHDFGSEDLTLSPQKEFVDPEPDPFDTSSVPTVIVPGKIELRLLESELAEFTPSTEPVSTVPLNLELSDFDFDPRAGEEPADPFVVDPRVVEDLDPFVVDHHLTSNLQDYQEDIHSDVPLCPVVHTQPQVVQQSEEVIHEDPFDTSAVKLNELYLGKKELQVLESELLNSHVDVQPPQNPLASLKAIQSAKPTPVEIPQEQELHPLDHTDFEHSQTPIQPLSPGQINGSGWDDPFDTSVADAIIPSKLQVKLLEEELGVHSANNLYDDPDFNPRETASSSSVHFNNCPLIPASAKSQRFEADPFDTSLADSLVPGKTELKVLEAELL